MNSTFFSLEAAKRGLMAHMGAVDVTGQNIANANTEGYTRQRVALTNLGPIGPAGGDVSSSIGRGVTIELVDRVKDDFLEDEIRKQQGLTAYWDSREETFNRIENLMLEPGDSGIRSMMDDFWQAMEDLTTYPDDPSYQTAAVQAGVSLASGTRYMEDQLLFLKNNLNDQISEKVDTINSNIRSIAEMNETLRRTETDSIKLNDLRDERDRLILDVSALLDITVLDGDIVPDSRILLDGKILVDGGTFNELTYNDGLNSSSYPELRFANDEKQFTTDRAVFQGSYLPSAADGVYKVKVEQLATEMTVENQGLVNNISQDEYLSKIDGIESGTFFINGIELSVDPINTTLGQFAEIVNQSEAGINVQITEAGRVILHSDKTGSGTTITMTDGSSNILTKLGLTVEVTGRAEPIILNPDTSLNIGGSMTINGKRVTIQQGINDSLDRIAEEINAGVPELEARIVMDKNNHQQIKLMNRENPYQEITLLDEPGGNILHRLGLVTVPFVETKIKGPLVKEGTDSRFTVNGNEFMRKDNLVKDAVKGVNLKLAGLGEAEVYVNNIAGDGELYALMESRDEVIPKYQEMLFNFMKTFTDSFNAVHFNGYNTQGGTHVNFFNTMPETLGETNSTDALLNFSVNEALIKDSTLLATATVDEEYFAETGVLRSKGVGDNSNALKMASLRFESIFADNSNVLDKYGQIFTTLGIDSQSTKATKFTQEQINLNLSNQKEQISGVSLDEEMTNLVRYQHGYSASARMISTIDGMLEVLINQVGR